MGAFTNAFKKFETKSNKTLEKICLDSILEISTRIIPRTPIDTGLARNSFVATVDTPTIISPNPADGPFPFQGTWSVMSAAETAPKSIGNVYYFTSVLEYIRGLEYGASKQAPNGMVRLTALEWQQVVKKHAAKNKK